MCVKAGGGFRVEKLLLAKGKDKRRGVEVVVGTQWIEPSNQLAIWGGV